MRARSLIAAVATAAALGGVALASPANAAGERITYDVTSNGPLLSVSFYDQMNEMQSLTNLGVSSWSTTFVGKATYQLSAISAQTNGTQVTCQIIKNGSVVAEQTTAGRYTMSVCAGGL